MIIFIGNSKMDISSATKSNNQVTHMAGLTKQMKKEAKVEKTEAGVQKGEAEAKMGAADVKEGIADMGEKIKKKLTR